MYNQVRRFAHRLPAWKRRSPISTFPCGREEGQGRAENRIVSFVARPQGEKKMNIHLRACPRCGGDIDAAFRDDVRCVQCGHRIYEPAVGLRDRGSPHDRLYVLGRSAPRGPQAMECPKMTHINIRSPVGTRSPLRGPLPVRGAGRSTSSRSTGSARTTTCASGAASAATSSALQPHDRPR